MNRPHTPSIGDRILMLVIVVQAIVAMSVIACVTFLTYADKLDAEATVAVLTGAVTLAGGIAGIVTATRGTRNNG